MIMASGEPDEPEEHIKLADVEARFHVKTVRLDSVDSNLAVADRIALSDAIIRRNLAYAIMGLFAAVNLATLIFVYLLFRVDQNDLANHIVAAQDRVVTANVLMTLLGATTVQLGSAMLIMARFIFRPAVDRQSGNGE